MNLWSPSKQVPVPTSICAIVRMTENLIKWYSVGWDRFLVKLYIFTHCLSSFSCTIIIYHLRHLRRGELVNSERLSQFKSVLVISEISPNNQTLTLYSSTDTDVAVRSRYRKIKSITDINDSYFIVKFVNNNVK